MNANIDTAAACNAFAAVYLDPCLSVFLNGNTGTDSAADINAFIAAYAIIVSVNYTAINHF